MFDFHEKRKLRNIMYSKPILGVLVIVMLFFGYVSFGAFEKERSTNEVKNQRASVLSELEERKEELRTEMERLETDRGIESEIRSKFEVAREGEEVIVIVDAPEEEVIIKEPEEPSFFERLFGN